MKLTEQAVASRLEYLSADGAVQVQALAGPEHSVAFLHQTHNSHSASLHLGV